MSESVLGNERPKDQFEWEKATEPPPLKRASLKRVAAASSIGTTIEFYDFFIFGTAAALVFPTIFFAKSDPNTALLQSFATFAVAFFARPVGAIVFGHYGDRIGRKRTLVWTLLIMGIATVGIGLLPGYATGAFGFFPGGIGIWAPTLLVAARFFQGFAVGGEWAGATLLTAEYAPVGKRGMMAMWPQLGPAFAFFLSSMTFLVFTQGNTTDADSFFMTIGWRVPFILSSLLVIVGLWIRLAVDETPVFKQAEKNLGQDPERKLPFLDAIKYQWKEILIAGGALASLFSLFYMGTSFLTSYATKQLGYSMPFVLSMGMIAAIVFGLSIAGSAMWSDKIGRRKVIMFSCALAIVWTLLLFPMLDSRITGLYVLGLMGTLVIFGIAYGPAGAALPEMFKARYRYTGAGLGYNLAGVLGGAIPPLIAARFVASGDSLYVGIMLAVLSTVSVLCAYLMVESKDYKMDAGVHTND
ncbi:MFS transporter [Mobilicoccus caccae]|uniref:MFS transporter n=1 Tax=Mobilicoccus caccae TaxID=1859295 RepID=A0ABQ6IUB2_9MICO|nr:MFS transporter [Mobilicoccus caccae]GMA40727.1 MFS transporter [Mobilicoccus caccae]